MRTEILDLSKVPVPDIIQVPSFEQEFEELKKLAIEINRDFEPYLEIESDPLTMILQTFAYRGLVYKAMLNDAVRANFLATAEKGDLDAKAAEYGQSRRVIQEADLTASPPIEAVYEDDDSLRRRAQLAFNNLNTAGSSEGYIFHTLKSDPRVLDAAVRSEKPCEITLPILSREGNGEASEELLNQVRAYFGVSPDERSVIDENAKHRPLGDRLFVRSATILEFKISARVLLPRGPSGLELIKTAKKKLDETLESNHRLGKMISRSSFEAALHQDGVINVYLDEPAEDIIVGWNEAGHCTGVEVEVIHDIPAAV